MKELKSISNSHFSILNDTSVIMKQFSDVQLERFEMFRTATIDQSKGYNKIKEVLSLYRK